MAFLVARVELYKTDSGKEASGEEYKKLHAAMKAKNWFQNLTSDGKTYNLPSGMYCAAKELTVDAARDEIYAIALTVWSNPAVVVSAGIAFKGLKS